MSVIGYGFANTGDELKFKLGSPDKPLLCNGAECVFTGKYASDREILCKIPPKSEVTYKDTGENIGDDSFAIEISLKNNIFTTNNISFYYPRASNHRY